MHHCTGSFVQDASKWAVSRVKGVPREHLKGATPLTVAATHSAPGVAVDAAHIEKRYRNLLQN